VLTREAADALRKYMQTRTDKNQRIFPYSAGHAQYVLKKAKTAAAAGAPVVRMKKNIGLFHWHATRKWFLSQFKISASMAVGEMLAGHTGYLDGAYRRYSDDTITEEFIKAEPFIQIEEGVSGGVS
ncbi:MAG: hypothetical protein Q4Q04_00785, partial [Methanocorpusculum sp.]|nr:hypothetical protein [Methanocorpusculum sp.]